MEPTWFSYKSFHRLLTPVTLLICLVFYVEKYNCLQSFWEVEFLILNLQFHNIYNFKHSTTQEFINLWTISRKRQHIEVIIKVGNNATLEKISTHCEKYSNFTRFFIRKFLMEEWLAVSSCLCPPQVTQPIKTFLSSLEFLSTREIEISPKT